MSAAHDVTVMGREFRIRSDDSAEHVASVVARVNATIDEVTGGRSQQPPSPQILMTALLNLADALIKAEGEHQALTERIRATSRRLLARMTATEDDARAAAGGRG